MNRKQRRISESQSSQAATVRINSSSYTLEEAHTLAIREYNLGNFQAVADIYALILTKAPQFVDGYINRGLAFQSLKRYNDALTNYDKALSLNPNVALPHSNKGITLQALKRYEDALKSYEKAIALNPQALTYFNYTATLQALSRYDEALTNYDKAIALQPDYAEAYINRGNVLHILKKDKDALASYEKAIQLKPKQAITYFNYAVTLQALSRYDDALTNYDKAIALQPDYAEAYINRGNVLQILKRQDDALQSYEKAVELNPGYANAHINRGSILYEMGRYDDALSSYENSIAINNNAKAWLHKSFIELLFGRYEEGWKHYEWRWQNKPEIARSFQKSLWLGKESLEHKTILLYAEQGLGDSLQFCRYVPMVEALGAKVILEVPSSLMELMSTLQSACQIIEQGATLPLFDFQCPLMSLPTAFKTQLDTIPAEPYLHAQPEFVEKWEPILNEKLGKPGDSLRIGLCWAGGQRPEQEDCVAIDARRSMSFNDLKSLLDIKNTSFVSLQLGAPKAQLNDERVLDISDKLHNWSDTAAVVSLLDLVITVDTSVCHLAGALGQKTFLLNRYDTCWRWLLNRDDSPWYPSLTQFRQENPGNWDSVIARVKNAIKSINN